MIYRYPYNLFKDMELKSSNGDISTLDPDDLILIFSNAGYLSKEEDLVLSKLYKEYKTQMGVSIETDMEPEDVDSFWKSGLRVLTDEYTYAKETNFWKDFGRSGLIAGLPVSIEAKKTLKNKGYETIGDLKSDPLASDVLNNIDSGSKSKLLDILSRVSVTGVKFVIIRRMCDRVVDGVFVEDGRPLRVYTGEEKGIENCVEAIYDASVLDHKKDDTIQTPVSSTPAKKQKPKDDLDGQIEISFTPEGEGKIGTPENSPKPKKKRATKPTSLLKNLVTYKKAAVFMDNGIDTLEDLSVFSKKELLMLAGVGSKTIDTLEVMLHDAGLSFAKDEEEKEGVESIPKVVSTDIQLDTPSTGKSTSEDLNIMLPSSFLVYMRSKSDVNLAVAEKKDILEEYKNYLNEEDRSRDLEIYTNLLNAFKGKASLCFINSMEKFKNGVFNSKSSTEDDELDKESKEALENSDTMCYAYFVKYYSSRLTENSFVRKLFSQICSRLTNEGVTFDIADVYDFCSNIAYNIPSDVCVQAYRYVYMKDRNLGLKLIRRVKTDCTYNKNLGTLRDKLMTTGFGDIYLNMVDDWCSSREVGYDYIIPELKTLNRKLSDGVVKFVSERDAVISLLNLYNGSFGLMSLVREKFPKYGM